MAKAAKMIRGKFADEKYLGPEPALTATSSVVEQSRMLAWYNYFYTSEEAKGFLVSYLRFVKADKETVRLATAVDPDEVRQLGWLCRQVSIGAVIPPSMEANMKARLTSLQKPKAKPAEPTTFVKKVLGVKPKTIQDRITDKANDLIAMIEDEIDVFYKTGKSEFDVVKFLRERDVTGPVAEKIEAYYKPLFEELLGVAGGKDRQLVEAYAHWSRPTLKAFFGFVKMILQSLEARRAVSVKIRVMKPRAVRVKPPAQVVAKVQYQDEDKVLGLRSARPTELVGAAQVWTYNTKYRSLSVYNATGASGISVKGTTLIGFDPESAVTKMLRKPRETIKSLMDSGAVARRKFMEAIKTRPKAATGRLNKDTIILKVIK